jgi:hypothetical protein
VPYVIDEHQEPYDYFRYTRYGLRYVLEKAGFSTRYITPSNGVHSSLLAMFAIMFLRYVPFSSLHAYLGVVIRAILSPLAEAMDRFDKERKMPLTYLYHGVKQEANSGHRLTQGPVR